MVSDLIKNLKDRKHHIKSLEIAENVVKLIDEIQAKEYAYKFHELVNDGKSFMGKV
jgi:hypothetical protein